MANTRSARKRIRANERRRIRNRAVRSSVRTKVTRARRALLNDAGGTATEADLREAIKALDRAAEKGILHRNNASRRKSRLAAMAAKLGRAAAGEVGEQAAARSAAVGGAKGRSAKAPARKSAAAGAKSARAGGGAKATTGSRATSAAGSGDRPARGRSGRTG